MIVELIIGATVLYVTKAVADAMRGDDSNNSNDNWKHKSTEKREMLIDRDSEDGSHFTFTPKTGNLHATFGKGKEKVHNFLGQGIEGHAIWGGLETSGGLEKQLELHTVHKELPESVRRHGWQAPEYPPSGLTSPHTDIANYLGKRSEDSEPSKIPGIDLDLSKLKPAAFEYLPRPTMPEVKLPAPYFTVNINESEENTPGWPSPTNWASPVLPPAETGSYEVMEEIRQRTEDMIARAQKKMHDETYRNCRNVEGEIIEANMAWTKKIPIWREGDSAPKHPKCTPPPMNIGRPVDLSSFDGAF